MKLELKHLAPYLPYNLMIQGQTHKEVAELFEQILRINKYGSLKAQKDDEESFDTFVPGSSSDRGAKVAVDTMTEGANTFDNNLDLQYIYSKLGYVYYELGNLIKAEQYCSLAIWYDDTDACPLRNLGVTYAEMKRYDDAIKKFKQALKINPDDSALYECLSCVYRELGNIKEAEAQVRKAMQIDPDRARSYFYLGLIYSSTGQKSGYKKAKKCYKIALKLDPLDALVLNELARIYCFLGQIDNAIEQCKKAVEVNLGEIQPYMELAGILFKEGNYKEVKKVLRKV